MKRNKLKVAVILVVIFMGLAAGCQLIRDQRIVKGVGKIEATYSLSLQDMSSGRASTPPKIYAVIEGKRYRLMPMTSTGDEITISKNDFLIEGVVPQFEGKSIEYYDQNHEVSKQILSEAEEMYKRLCDVRPAYSKTETARGLADRILSYVKDGDTRLIITTNIKSLK
jgi:hypothetical protein